MENNYQLSRIHNYVHGLMSPDDMHALEREALDDPFLQDAIDGYRLQQGVDAKQLSILQQRLASRLANQPTERNKQFFNWQRLAIGSVAAVMFVVVCTLILMRFLPQKNTVDIKEVVLSESVYEYSIQPALENTALPYGDWDKLYDKLHRSYSNSNNFKGELVISFDIIDKKAQNIKISGENYQEDEELEDILRNKIDWKGKSAHFKIVVE